MITYEPRGGKFGSIEEAIFELEGMLLMLRDPGAIASLRAAYPACIASRQVKPVVNVAANVDTGHLMLIAVADNVLPDCDNAVILIHEAD